MRNSSDDVNSTYSYVQYFSGGVCRLESDISVIIYAAVLIILAIIATLENLAVILAIFKYKILRSTSMVLLGILGVVDLVTGAVVTPLKVWITLHHGRFDFKMIIVFMWLFITVVYFSLSTVLAISFDRFCHVYFLDKYKPTLKKMGVGLFVCWSVPIAIVICALVGHMSAALFLLCLIYFLLCIVALVLVYIGMVVSLKRHSSNEDAAGTQPNIENERQAVRTTLLIIATCLVMNLPPVLSIVLAFHRISSKILCAVTFFFLLANSAVNPVIYCMRIPLIKKYVFRLLCNKKAFDAVDQTIDGSTDRLVPGGPEDIELRV